MHAIGMSALSYLRELQGGVRYRIYVPDDIVAKRSHELQGYQEAYDRTAKTIEAHEEWFKRALVEPLIYSVPRPLNVDLSAVVVGLMPTYDPNAWSLKTPDGDDLIVVHTELLSALSFYNEVQLTYLFLRDENTKEARRIFGQGMEFIRQSFVDRVPVQYPAIPHELPSHFQQLALMKTMAQELFVIAHEFSHINLGHTAAATETMSSVIQHRSVEKIGWQHRQELDADFQAFRWLCGLKSSSRGLVQFVSQAPFLAAEVLVFMHVVESFFATGQQVSSHPSALARLKSLHERSEGVIPETIRTELFDMSNILE